MLCECGEKKKNPCIYFSFHFGLHKARSRHSLGDVLLISLCFDMFPGAVCRLLGGGRRELHRAVLLTRGLWGMAHTWKHFRASLHCNWAYYHNYSFKARAICIRHAPAQPPGLWPCGATAPPSPPTSLFTFYTLPFVFAFHSIVSHSSLVTSTSGEKRDYSGVDHVCVRVVWGRTI